MKRKILIVAVVVAAMFSLLLTGCSDKSKAIKMGSAGEGGGYNLFAEAFSTAADSSQDQVTVENKVTAGSAANIRLISKDYIRLALVQNDIANDAFYGENSYKGSAPITGYSAIASLYTEACQIVVRKDSGITSISQLKDKKVSVGEEESGTEQNATQILTAAGLPSQLYEVQNMTYTEAAVALREGSIDAMFVTAGAPAAVLTELFESADVMLLSIDPETVSRLKDIYPFYISYTIPAGTYKGQTEAASTVGVKALLVASDQLPAETVELLTGVLFDHSDELQEAVSVKLELDKDKALEGITIPIHPGAASYYEKNGVTVPDKLLPKGE